LCWVFCRSTWPRKAVAMGAPVMVVNMRGASPRREEVWLLVAEGNCVARQARWRATGGERSVRNASELDSAGDLGEPAHERRSPSDANDLVRGVTVRKRHLPVHAVKPERQNPNTAIGKVKGGWRWKDRKIDNLSRETCSGTAGPIGIMPRKSRRGRSQSVRSSVEAG
jgi:hypothetical protein